MKKNLPPLPRPTECGPKHGEAEEIRNLFCSHYRNCLNQAVVSDWENWSCRGCDLAAFTPKPQVRDYATEQRRSGE